MVLLWVKITEKNDIAWATTSTILTKQHKNLKELSLLWLEYKETDHYSLFMTIIRAIPGIRSSKKCKRYLVSDQKQVLLWQILVYICKTGNNLICLKSKYFKQRYYVFWITKQKLETSFTVTEILERTYTNLIDQNTKLPVLQRVKDSAVESE